MPEPFDPNSQAEFDRYAGSYEDLHAASIAASGESTEYFAVYKQRVLERMLGKGYDRPVLDFGCGIGNLTRLLVDSFPTVHAYDPSAECAKLARQRTPKAVFFEDMEELPKDHYGAIVMANCLHHVPLENRPGLAASVAAMLARGGRLIVFEHNPLNPLTRRVVAACPFDENAELLYPWEVKRLLRGAGLAHVRREFIVFFPRPLAFARGLESRLGWLPLGAQMCVWAVKR